MGGWERGEEGGGEEYEKMFMQPPPGASGGFIPPIKYNAISGRLTLEDREQAISGEWEKKITDITMSQPTFAVDFGNLNVGWVLFIQGIAPQYALVPYGQPMPERPASPGNDVAGKALNYRNGFRVPVGGGAIGGVREFAGNSAALINGMNDLHSAYEAAPEAAMGKIPVVKMIRTDAINSGKSTNYQPVFQIVAWADRPDVLGPRTVPAPRAQAPVAPPVVPSVVNGHPGYTQAQPVQQPAARPVQKPVMADSDMPFAEVNEQRPR